MSRTRAPTLQLQLVATSSGAWGPKSSWERTTRSGSPRRTLSSPARGSRPALRCSEPSAVGASIGYRSLSSPAGSSRVH